MSVLIPDCSEYQIGPSGPDWAGIKKQNGGAGICRVGYGTDHLDHMFVSNYTAMKKNAFSFIGLYHYLRQDQDAGMQAAAFCGWVGPPSAVAPGTVFMLDLEEGSGNQSARANAWLTHVDNFYGLVSQPLNMRSWLYSYVVFANNHGLGPLFASARRTWIAAYSSTEPSLGHTLWQSTNGTDGANIVDWAGCGRCDTSIFHGTLPDLAATGWQGTPSDPPPVTQPEETMIRAEDKTHAISFANGAYSFISFFCDNTAEGRPTQVIRVAPWTSDTHGFAGITTVSVDVDHEKVTVQLPAHCAGISLQRASGAPTDWVPVAYNLG